MGKANSHRTALPRCFFWSLCMQCFRVSIPPAVRPFFFLRQMDMGSLTCAQIWVRVVHTNNVQNIDLAIYKYGTEVRLASVNL